MEQQTLIYNKLEAFIKKFYTNELLKGTIFFVGIGLIYFLVTLFIEYFLWLKPIGRSVLFWGFVIVEVLLFTRYLLFPSIKLFKLQKGIDFAQASLIIGNHFSEVTDKLTNFIQLANDKNQSELLVASIEQKAKLLQPIPFGNAINFKKNITYLPLALLPIVLFLVIYISGNSTIISQSFNRVVHFNQQFLPPAPFQFVVQNQSLQTEQNQDFVLKVKTVGSITPDKIVIFIGSESYFMQKTSNGFEYTFEKPTTNTPFQLSANDVSSKVYELSVATVPSIADFEMKLYFPRYLKKVPEIIKGNGNAIVPEGTQVLWKLKTIATNQVTWSDVTGTSSFSKQTNLFVLSKKIMQNTLYQIGTSNQKVKDYEKLNYQISVLKDQYPVLTISQAPDSLKVSKNYLLGAISDDYGLSKLQVIYYPKNNPAELKKGTIAIKNNSSDRFVFSFPSSLPVNQGVTYDYYFEVFDNDALHNFKSTKSAVFSNRIATEEEKTTQLLDQQNETINGLEKSLSNQEKQLSQLDKLQKTGKEKASFEYKDQQKVTDFIQRQKQQDEMMKEFSKKMEDNLDRFKADKKDSEKETLKKRLDEAAKELEKNNQLLDELKALNDKLESERLLEKLDEFKQKAKNQTKSLEQLVELTKRYYVEKKAEQLAEKLQELANKQEDLSNKDKGNTQEKQQEINKEFDALQKELTDLQKENKELKAPMEIPKDAEKEKDIEKDLNKASEELQKQSQSKAKPKQKSAAKKMKEMSSQIMESMGGGEMEQLEEDVKMLRQILDNLLAFSFSQEELATRFKGLKRGSPSFNSNLKTQQSLKTQFKHIDDSLFAMSLRNPKIAENITKEVGNVHYNINKSLDNFADVQLSRGIANQQFVITSSNKLADFLSEVLTSMQMQLSGSGSGGKPKPGKGEGEGMQLPDIIKKQEGLSEQMKKSMKKGEKPGEGKEGKSDSKGKPGGEKKPGQVGNEGEGGQDGEGNAGELMKIYQEQKQLREDLQKALEKVNVGGLGQSALDKMKQLEKQLLNKGFTNETLQKALNLNYELLKLEKATQQQGEENKRQSETNNKQFQNQAKPLPKVLQDYINSTEILNRQNLPLRQNYNQKVQYYFKKND